GRAVHALPEPDVERDAHRGSPGQLLGREPAQAAVRRDRGQRPPEPEAVREIDVGARLAELVAEEAVAIEDVPDKGLGRGDVHVPGVYPAPRHAPPALADVVLEARVSARVVFTGEHVAEGALEAEDVAGVLLEELKVVVERVGDVLADRVLDGP